MTKAFFLFLIATASLAACTSSKPTVTAGLPPYAPASQALHDTIVQLDSLFFEAYNACKLDVFASYLSEDMEFFHDRGGRTTSKASVVEGVKNNVCNKSSRELLPGSIEVYPIPNYGAIEIGVHRFYNRVENSRGKYARFVQIWHRENGQWRITRVVSLH